MLLVLVIITGCATIFSGTQQQISFNTYPSGAEIYVNGTNTNRKTPSAMSLPRRVPATSENNKNQYVYNFKLDGYEEGKVFDDAETNNVVWFNLLFPYVAILTIPLDFATGAAKKYDGDVSINLSKKSGKTDTIYQKEIVYVPTGNGKPEYVFERKSDVDQNIPITPSQYPNRFALIIGNEDYSSHQTEIGGEINVAYARNDASAIKEYCTKAMGVPEENVIFLLDATTGQMNQAISKANKLIKATQGKGTFYVYYAGHGLPDEVTKEAYLMPVDVSGKNANEGILLKNFYEKLTEFPAERITVFIDACFSGGARNQGLLAARGVKINPKVDADATVKGNLVVFSASSGEQSSLPYKAQQHGIFTYYLLKKLKESGGNVTYSELSEYITEKVSLQSLLINDKEQNPKVNVSTNSQEVWKTWTIK